MSFRGERYFSQGAVRRGEEKLNILLPWVYQWGWTVSANIQELFGLERDQCAIYEKKGILVKIDPPSKILKPVYVLHPGMVQEAIIRYERQTGRVADLPYGWPKRKIPWGSYHHHIASQSCAIKVMEHEEITAYRELEFSVTEGELQPDFLSKDRFERVVWHEIELKVEPKLKMMNQLHRRAIDFQQGKFQEIVIWYRVGAVREGMKAILSRERVPGVAKSPSGNYVIDQMAQTWSPAALSEVVTFRHIDTWEGEDI
jgi:hypothetical protein